MAQIANTTGFYEFYADKRVRELGIWDFIPKSAQVAFKKNRLIIEGVAKKAASIGVQELMSLDLEDIREEARLKIVQEEAKTLVSQIRPRQRQVEEGFNFISSDPEDSVKVKEGLELMQPNLKEIERIVKEFKGESEELRILDGTLKHEINNPLAPLISTVDFVKQYGLENEDLDTITETMARIDKILFMLESIVRIETKPYSPIADILDLEASSVEAASTGMTVARGSRDLDGMRHPWFQDKIKATTRTQSNQPVPGR
jgi:hypothetical protein